MHSAATGSVQLHYDCTLWSSESECKKSGQCRMYVGIAAVPVDGLPAAPRPHRLRSRLAVRLEHEQPYRCLHEHKVQQVRRPFRVRV